MGKGVCLLVFGVLSANVLTSGFNVKERKQCCDLGTNYANDGFECKTFVPEMAGNMASEKKCLNMVDVCCEKRQREVECSSGSENAKQGLSCPAGGAGEKKVCCEACQAGMDAGRSKEPCDEGLGLGSPYDDTFKHCCEEALKTPPTSPRKNAEDTTTPAPTTLDIFNGDNDSYLNTPMENICDSDVCSQICELEGDSYRCDCYKGYILMDDEVSCKPQKRSLQKGGRCEIHNPCDHDCTDTGIAIKCSCREGYELADDSRTCRDINECTRNLHDCVSVADCINEFGTYSCYDPILPDENETINYENKCPDGFHFNFKKLACDDIDECKFDLMCIPPKTCKNTIGSFVCEGEDIPQCPPGFHFKASTESCTDIDECLIGKNDCNKESQVCLNTKGNYTCVDKASRNACPPGFKKNATSQLCDDINECEEEDGLCAENEKCVNELGGHTCIPLQGVLASKASPSTTSRPTTTRTTVEIPTTRRQVTCPTGYSYYEESNVCADVNECQMGTHDCEIAERCDNTIGSYHCSRILGCGTGYTLNGNNGLCEDDDECALKTDNCRELGSNFKCRNTLGSYRCEHVRPKYKPSTPPTPTSTSPSTPERRTTPDRTTPTTTRITNPDPPIQYPLNNPQAQYTYPTFNYPTLPPKTRPTPGADTIRGTVIPLGRDPALVPDLNNRVSGTLIPIGREPPTPAATTTVRTPPLHNTIIFKPYPTPSGTLPYYSPRRTTPRRTTTRSTTTRTTTTTTQRSLRPIPFYPVISGQLKNCLPGYRMNYRGECEDINECVNNPCKRFEKCLNFNGRYECASPMLCKMGFELNESGDQCVDINECTRGTHKCQPTQICKNYHGYYTCECPPGHHLNKKTGQCEDLDECRMFRPCRVDSTKCINLIGSFRCDCIEGFERKTTNECSDIDECTKTPGLCEHNCVNLWGTYRCSCNQGFTLNNDNRTCTDIDECERFKDSRLCIGTCKNVPGSYTCECPKGYRLGGDRRVCRDIDECQESNICQPDEVCLNTRGGYKCYMIKCPENYEKDSEHKARCKRLPFSCDKREYQCLMLPEQYTYQYITLVSNLPLTHNINLFKIRGPEWYSSKAQFTMKLKEVRCPEGVEKVNEHYFQKVDENFNSMTLYLVRPIQGPQEIKIQIEMRLFQDNTIIGNAVVYIIIVVSEYSF